uniref:Uncharacterized protein n=1 Tax=Meloidogyne enterolobii TaxID=390850 RepID=A0A6V7UL17_MELEN|nr:unnamed protein product [Meloidogyne enterolobii]
MNTISVIFLIVMFCIEEKTCMNTGGGGGRRGGRRGESRGKAVQVKEEPSLDELFQFHHDLQTYQNLANEVHGLRNCLQTIQQNKEILQQILAASDQNNQNLRHLFQNTRQINDPQQNEENMNIANALFIQSCSSFVTIQDLTNSTNIGHIQIQYEMLLDQTHKSLRHLLDNLNQQIQTISQINPSMAQQLREQLEVIQKQTQNIHHHEAGPSHQVQAGAGPSHQVQAGAGPSHQVEPGPSHQIQDPETHRNLMYHLFGTSSSSNHNGGSEATPNDSDEN